MITMIIWCLIGLVVCHIGTICTKKYKSRWFKHFFDGHLVSNGMEVLVVTLLWPLTLLIIACNFVSCFAEEHWFE